MITDDIQTIIRCLTPDLLRAEYRGHPDNPTYGHCYVAAEALFHLRPELGLQPHYGRTDDGGTHWWLVDPESGQRHDPTAAQFSRMDCEPPYDNGVRTGFLTRQPSKRCAILLGRIHEELEHGTNSF